MDVSAGQAYQDRWPHPYWRRRYRIYRIYSTWGSVALYLSIWKTQLHPLILSIWIAWLPMLSWLRLPTLSLGYTSLPPSMCSVYQLQGILRPHWCSAEHNICSYPYIAGNYTFVSPSRLKILFIMVGEGGFTPFLFSFIQKTAYMEMICSWALSVWQRIMSTRWDYFWLTLETGSERSQWITYQQLARRSSSGCNLLSNRKVQDLVLGGRGCKIEQSKERCKGFEEYLRW